jgi:hypothetical protein
MFFKKKPKKNMAMTDEILDYFNMEVTEGKYTLTADFRNKSILHWFVAIHDTIQEAFRLKLFRGVKIENYLSMTSYIGGQRVDIVLVKDGCKCPVELLEEARVKIKQLEAGSETYLQYLCSWGAESATTAPERQVWKLLQSACCRCLETNSASLLFEKRLAAENHEADADKDSFLLS